MNSRLTTALANSVYPLLTLGALLLIWESVSRNGLVAPFLLPAPSTIGTGLIRHWPLFLSHSLTTLHSTVIGFALAVGSGVLIAILVVRYALLDRTVYPLLVAFNSIPKVALAPLVIIWLGTGVTPKVVLAMLIAIFPIVIATVQGMRAVEPGIIDLGRASGARPIRVILKIRLPNAIPSLFAGMKIGVTLALIGSIVGEFVASNRGLGYLLLSAQGQFDVARMFGALFMLALIGLTLFYTIVLLEKWIVHWQRDQGGSAEVH